MVFTLTAIRSEVTTSSLLRATNAIHDKMWIATVNRLFVLTDYLLT
ncbi:hypothetical protein ACIHDR_45010 [Nocardia sp. NPDC052278]